MSGNDCWNSVCFSCCRKAENELADVTLSGSLFQNCAAATGNALRHSSWITIWHRAGGGLKLHCLLVTTSSQNAKAAFCSIVVSCIVHSCTFFTSLSCLAFQRLHFRPSLYFPLFSCTAVIIFVRHRFFLHVQSPHTDTRCTAKLLIEVPGFYWNIAKLPQWTIFRL